MSFSTTRGFTLLEILVALAILAIALSAVLKATAEGVGHVAYMRDRTLASWVAQNQINEKLLESAWPARGVSEGRTEMAGRDWQWEIRISDTPDPDLRRLDVTVRLRDEPALLAELIAFKGRAGP